MKKKSTKVLSGALATTTVLGSVMGATTAMAEANVDELYNAAYNATNAAKEEKTQESINTARKAIRQLKVALENDKALQANLIGTLSEALDPVQHNLFVAFYDILYKEDKVTEKESLTQAQINSARQYIEGFKGSEENSPYVSSWSTAVDKFQQANMVIVKEAVEKAKETKLEADILAASKLVEELLTVTNNEGVKEFAQGLQVIVKDLENKEEALVEVQSINSINENTVQVKGLAKEVKEADLVGKKITLKAGETSLIATYVATSVTADGKANFVLDDEKKLTDATIYTVSSEWARFTKDTFMAKGFVDPYVNKVEVLTKGVPANTAASNLNLVHFTAKNQYGEDIVLAGNVAHLVVKGTINGVPFIANELQDQTDLENGIVEINKDLKEGDKVTLTFTNTINGKADVEVGKVSYTVVKEEVAVPTIVSDMKATYVNSLNGHVATKEAEEVLPDDQVKLTIKVSDQFGNPIKKDALRSKVRWVVEEGRTHTNIHEDVTDGDNELTFTATEAGDVKISAYIANGQKVTYEVKVGAKKLSSIGTVIFADAKNHEEAISTELVPNQGAVLKASDVKFEITSLPKGATKDDIKLVAVQGDKEETKDKIYVKATTKIAGEYKFKAYVGKSIDEEGAVASLDSTITTTVNQTVNSIEVEPFLANELTAEKEVIKKVTFKNKWNEEVTVLGNDLKVAYTNNMRVTKLEEDKVSEATDNAVKYLKFVGEEEGNDTVTLVTGSKSMSLNLTTQKAAAIKTVNLGQDITTGVIAGQVNRVAADKIYAPITVKNNYGNEVIPTAEELGNDVAGKLRVTVAKIAGDTTEWQVPAVAIKYYKLDKDGKIVAQLGKDVDTVGIALEIDANACDNTTDKIATITISNGEAAEKEIKDTLNVSIKAVRKLSGITVTPKSATIGLNATTLVTVKPVDQYGDFIALENPTAVGTITSSEVATADFGQFLANGVNGQLPSVGSDVSYLTVDKDGKYTDNIANVTGYVYAIKGNKTGEVTVTVKDVTPNSTLKDTATIKVTPAASVVNSIKLVNDNINTDGTYKYKVVKGARAVTFGIKAYDVNGNEVAVNPADVIWTSNEISVAEVANGVVTTKDIGEESDKIVTITASIGLVKQSISLIVSKDDAAMVPGTVKVVAPEEVDADTTKAGIQISLDGKTEDGEVAEGEENAGTITLTFKGMDQFGEEADIVELNTPVQVRSFNPEVATVGAWDDAHDKLTITPVEAGNTTVKVTVGTQDILLDVIVTDKNINVVAKNAVEALEAAVKKDLTEQSNIELAKAAKAVVDTEISKLHSGAVHDALNARVQIANNLITGAEQAAADKLAAGPVKEEIANLPAKDEITLLNKKAVTDAKEHYEALSQPQKNLVGDITKLTDAEAKIAELELAQAKKGLTDKIAEAGRIHDEATEGAEVGNYVVGAKAILNRAKEVAQQALDNEHSTTENLNQATNTLNQAMETFKAAPKVEVAKAEPTAVTIDSQAKGSTGKTTITLDNGSGETLELVGANEEFATVKKEDSTGVVTVTSVADGSYDLIVQVKKGGQVIRTVKVKVTVSNQIG